MIRAIRRASGILSSIALSSFLSSALSMSSSFSAWGTVRGKPSRMKPFLQSLLLASSDLIMPIIMSSETRPPASMIFLAALPSSVCFETWARSMSPVARWQQLYFSEMEGACVPLPAPGGPMRMSLGASVVPTTDETASDTLLLAESIALLALSAALPSIWVIFACSWTC